MKKMHHLLSPLLTVLILAGCASAPPVDTAQLPITPATFKEEGHTRWTVSTPAESQARGAWWKSFNDPALDDLVDRAGARNTSIQTAAARLAQARALLRSADADRLPQVGLGAGVKRQAAPAIGTPLGTVANVGANLSYELDLFGRLAKASDAASLDAKSREALLQSTRLLVQSNVAQSYLQLRALDTERALVRDTVEAYRNTLSLTERRFQAGDVAELDVARVRTEVAATESEAIALDRRRAELEHALAVLVGEAASSFQVEPRDWNTKLPLIPAGVPSTVLARRPDVSAAQTSLLAAQARVGVAKAAWFPSLSLTANGGYASPDLGDLFKWSTRAWGVGALLSLPIFDGGKRESGIQIANADLDIAGATYREQVLVAFKDVEDQLSALRLLADQAQAQSRAVDSATRATVLSESRYRNGLVSQLELLDAQRSELSNRRQALQVRSAQYQATVGLVRALGGAWE
ncbi:efflux transporter outer membrane subunit [Aquabacterium sp. CECT 9606]|uniref:efflux transporter outer membrane subunit n=1 Tax=Aquabacterium sp. CECT 9606 TaxID=2845822 RepID=UPI001E5AC3F0|nr:efflux transporter outer membrane subunit [Aquabacterium sp. CECT 9606]CAH0350664.1 putative efflux pump outer membrane protein TtgC [Aquabacterium sp. CECT 9606]